VPLRHDLGSILRPQWPIDAIRPDEPASCAVLADEYLGLEHGSTEPGVGEGIMLQR